MQVHDVMTRDVITVREHTPVREIAQIMAAHGISGVPVCDGDGHMIGVVTEHDLLGKPGANTAGDAMTRDVVSVMEETSLEEVRYLLVHRKFKRVPVLRGQKLVGIVSRSDLVREMALTWVCQVCGEHQRGRDEPEYCPRCGHPSEFQPALSPPIGEGADVPD